MSRQQQFYPLRGGLDQETPTIAIPPGRAAGVLNHEATPLGYQRTEGFERFDGQPAPSAAHFFTLTFTEGAQAFVAGQTITGFTSAATFRVLAEAVLDSGSFAGSDAVGTLPVHLVAGTFIAAELLKIAATTYARLTTAPTLGDWREGADQLAWFTAAQTYARDLITAVPGSGAIRGIVWFDDKMNAWRDNAAATAGVLHHSSTVGWTATSLGYSLAFVEGGPYEIVPGDVVRGDQSGATATVRYVGLNDGAWEDSDATGVLILDGIAGSFGDETISVGTQVAIGAISTDPQAVVFPAGGRYEFDIFNFFATEGYERCYGANGVSKAFEFDGDSIAFIATGAPVDRPRKVRVHKEHLFLDLGSGSLQHSSLGLPRDFSGVLGAAELGMGHEITNLIGNTNGAMLVFTDKTTSTLTGNDSSDWLLEPIAHDDAGAKEHTAQRIGDVIYLDNRGLRNAAATQQFANFRLGTYTRLINKELSRKRASGVQPVASGVVKSKDQYLLFFDDGSGISLWFGAKQPEAMLFQYPFVVSCLHIAEVDGAERVWVGTEDGFVHELNKGTSFDGDVIEAYLQLPFGHQGNPRVLKRYEKLELEMSGAPGTEIALIAQFDFGGDEQPFTQEDMLTLAGGGGLWGLATWGDFIWSAPLIGRAEFWIDGMGANMSPIFVSRQSTVPSYTISGVMTVFSPRGAKR